jgi:hypothetical protein
MRINNRFVQFLLVALLLTVLLLVNGKTESQNVDEGRSGKATRKSKDKQKSESAKKIPKKGSQNDKKFNTRVPPDTINKMIEKDKRKRSAPKKVGGVNQDEKVKKSTTKSSNPKVENKVEIGADGDVANRGKDKTSVQSMSDEIVVKKSTAIGEDAKSVKKDTKEKKKVSKEKDAFKKAIAEAEKGFKDLHNDIYDDYDDLYDDYDYDDYDSDYDSDYESDYDDDDYDDDYDSDYDDNDYDDDYDDDYDSDYDDDYEDDYDSDDYSYGDSNGD